MYLRYRIMADELRAAGIDVNCAPCADLAVEATHPFLRNRCYGSEPGRVSGIARAVATGLMAGGVLPVLKHLPGHGRATVDSHEGLPHTDAAPEDLTASDFAVFRALSDLPLGMTAHVVYDAYDDRAATVSARMIRLIREEIGFDGLLMTDDIGMGALGGTAPRGGVRPLPRAATWCCTATRPCPSARRWPRPWAACPRPRGCGPTARFSPVGRPSRLTSPPPRPNLRSFWTGGWMTEPDNVVSVEARLEAEALIVDVDGFEGPLDLLLTLSRTQKVDLRKISVLKLAEQYLAFIDSARDLRIELAADYLVMAAWLAFLKSRLLLPPDPADEGPSGEDLAAHLAFQLERLQAMREVAARLMGRDQKGRDFFVRGLPEGVERVRKVRFTATLLDLMQAYARIRTRDDFRPFVMDRRDVLTMEQALDRMRQVIGFAGDWTDLAAYLPEGWETDPVRRRSATAATFAASLELAKEGRIELRQGDMFAPIQIRRREGPNGRD
jgi:segregation and condensation protein A